MQDQNKSLVGESGEEQNLPQAFNNHLMSSLSGSLTGSLSGSLMAISMKDMKSLRDELRVSKRQEQLTKEKLNEAKKSFEHTEEAYNKYRTDAEQRLESLRAENNMLQLSLKHLQEKNEIIEKTSQNSQESPDVLRLIDEYSRSNELKSKEIQDLLASASTKKVKYQTLKRSNAEMEQKLARLQSNLENLKKFSRIFIKSMQTQNSQLKATVVSYQRDFSDVIEQTKLAIEQQVTSRLTLTKSHYEAKIQVEKQHVLNLNEKLSKLEQEIQKLVSRTELNTQASTQVMQLQNKNEKLRSKISCLNKSLTDADSDVTSHQVDVLKLQLESEQQKHSIQLQERDKNINLLQQQLDGMLSRETNLSIKLDQTDIKSRQEYQRLIEMYEGSSRYKELRDLYEEKLHLREIQFMEAKEELTKLQVKMEFMTQKEQEQTNQLRQRDEMLIENRKEHTKALETAQQIHEKHLTEKYSKYSKLSETLKAEHFQNVAMVKGAFEEKIRNQKFQHETEINHLTMCSENEKLRVETQCQAKLQEELFLQKSQLRDVQMQLSRYEQTEGQNNLKLDDYQTRLRAQQLFIVDKNLEIDKLSARVSEVQQMEVKISKLQDEIMRNQNNVSITDAQITKKNTKDAAVQTVQIEDFSSVPPQKIKSVSNYGTQTRKRKTMDAQIETNGQETDYQLHIMPTQEEESEPVVELLCRSTSQKKDFQPDQGPRPMIRPAPTPVRPNAPRIPRMPVPQITQVPKAELKDINQQHPAKSQPTQPFAASLPFQTQNDQTTITKQKEIENSAQEDSHTVEPTPRSVIEPIISTFQVVEQKEQATLKVEALTVSKEPTTPRKIEEIKTKPTPQVPATTETGGIFSMFNSLVNLITRRKQAYQGKPSTAMYYDEKKKRYVIDGEDSEGEDVPPPPPPKAKPKEEEEVKTQQQVQQDKAVEHTGLNSLTQPGFSGTLANRNRGRGQRPAPSLTPKLISPIPSVIEKPQQNVQDVVSHLVDESNVEQTMDQTFFTIQNESLNMTAITANLNQTRFEAEAEIDREREQQWNLKFNQQNEKISQMRYQVQLLQEELRKEKSQNQQTISELESFSKEMSQEGQFLQQHINDLNGKQAFQGDELILLELKRWQAEDSLQMSDSELSNARLTISNLKQKVFALELKDQMQALKVIPDVSMMGATVPTRELDEAQDRVETLLWKLSVEQVKQTQLSNVIDRQKHDSLMVHQELHELKHESQSQQRLMMEQIKSIEREKDVQLKEAIQRSNADRDRMLEQMRKGINERDLKIKKQESENAILQADFQMKMHEQQHSWQTRYNELLQRSEEEIKSMTEVMNRQQEQLKQQQKLEQSRVKTHLKSLEVVLTKKDMDLQQVLGKHDEAQQELQSMSEMRQKLNEHIMYLQNEIRKRDELLENSSDFEDDQDNVSNSFVDESMCSGQGRAAQKSFIQDQVSSSVRKRKNAFARQLDESRTHLSKLIEEKLKLQKDNSELLSQTQRLQSGLEDICQMLDSTNPVILHPDQDIVHFTIQRFFTQKGRQEAEILQLQHKVDMLTLHCEDTENMKFDIDLLSEERDLIQDELMSAYQTIQDLETTQQDEFCQQINNLKFQLTEKTHQFEESEQKLSQKINSLKDQYHSSQEEHQIALTHLNQKIQSYQSLCSNLQQNQENLQVEQTECQGQIKVLSQKINELSQIKQSQDVQIEEMMQENQRQEVRINDDSMLKQELHAQMQSKDEQLALKISKLKQWNKR